MPGLKDIVARRALIARQRDELDRLEADLVIAERVLRMLDEDKPEQLSRNGATTSSGLPPQWASAMEALGDDEMKASDLRTRIDVTRDTPITDGSYQALLSKLKGAGLIVREGTTVRKRRPDETEAAEASPDEEEAPTSSTNDSREDIFASLG